MIKLLKASPASRIMSATLPSRRRSAISLLSEETTRFLGSLLCWEVFVNFFYTPPQKNRSAMHPRRRMTIHPNLKSSTYQVEAISTEFLGCVFRKNSKHKAFARVIVESHSSGLNKSATYPSARGSHSYHLTPLTGTYNMVRGRLVPSSQGKNSVGNSVGEIISRVQL
jgi:hypothetical protein